MWRASVSSVYLASAIFFGASSLLSAVAKLVAVLRAKDITVRVRGRWR
jgi:hypothetical protein